jgi:hypothetical protein
MNGPAVFIMTCREKHKKETQGVHHLWVEVVALDVATVFKVEVAFWLVEEDLEEEATCFFWTSTLAEGVPEAMSLAPLMPLDLLTEPTDFFM